MGAQALGVSGPQRFELLRHLGSGGMGSVFEALDHELGVRVALKTLRTPSPDALLYLKNEFRALQDVRHENLVQLLDLVEEDGRFFVAMELVEGTDLLGHLRPGDTELNHSGVTETRAIQGATQANAAPSRPARSQSDFDEPRVRSTFSQLAAGLAALHERGKVHRDVKPSNVLVDEQGRVVLVDFGLTTETSLDPAARDARGVGTRAFMAPEQAAGQHVTSAADWYSFGVALYWALTGVLPFRGPELERAKLATAPEPIARLCPQAPSDLAELALALLDPDPARRPNQNEVLRRLGAAARPQATGTPFLGRTIELEQLEAAFADARRKAVLSLVIADSGLGKSSLVRELVTRLPRVAADVLVLSSRCYERELVPFKAFDGIVDSLSHFLCALPEAELERLLPASAGRLTRLFPVLARVSCLAERAPEEWSDPQTMRAAAFAALRELFSCLATERPVLLYIDDLQWADADSHLLLSDLLRAPQAPRLCVVATARPERHAGSDVLLRLRDELGADVRTLLLEPLPMAECRALAGNVLGAGADSQLARAVAAEAGGHPLFVQALAEHARNSGQLQLSTLRLEDALLARIGVIEPEARRLLELITLAGAPLARTTAVAASTLDPVTIAASVSTLRLARLVRTSSGSGAQERIEPYHDRVRETVLAQLGPDLRREHHGKLADALQRTGRSELDPQGLVRHLEGAERFPEAAEQAETAARLADRALAFDQASELYSTALRLGRFAAQREHQLTLALAEALTNAGRAMEAARAFSRVAETAEPERQVEYRRHAADHLLRSGHLADGMATLSLALRELDDDLRSQTRSLFTTLVARARLKLRGLGWTARPANQVPKPLRRRIEAYHAVGVSLALIDPARGAAFEARALRLALDAGDPRLLGPILVMECGYEGALGERGLERAERLMAEVRRIIELTGDHYIATAHDMMRGFLDYHAGNFEAASQLLARVETTFGSIPGSYFEQKFCLCFRLICLRNCGRLGELEAGFAGFVRDAERRGDRFSEAALRFNLNLVWLMRDSPEEALRDLARVRWMPPTGGYHVQHWYEHQARAEIDLYTGNAPAGLVRFREVLESLERSFILRMRLHRCHAQWILGRLILAATPGPLSPAAKAELSLLTRKLGREKLASARTWAHLLQAGALYKLGNQPAAISQLEAAQQLAREHHLYHYEHSAGFHLGQLQTNPHAEQLALAWAHSQNIAQPAQYFRSWCPGLG